MNRDIAGSQVAAGGITIAGLNGQRVERPWRPIVGHIDAKGNVAAAHLRAAVKVRLISGEGQ